MRPVPAELSDKLMSAASSAATGPGLSMSMDDLARESGVPRATLYYYFGGREDLVSFYVGVMIRRNILIMMMSVELMLNAVNLTLIAFSRAWGHATGQGFAFFIVALAAAEAAVGLAIVVAVFRSRKTVNVDELMGAMRYDKKVMAGRQRLVLPTGLGAAEITDDVPADVVRAAWAHVGAASRDP